MFTFRIWNDQIQFFSQTKCLVRVSPIPLTNGPLRRFPRLENNMVTKDDSWSHANVNLVSLHATRISLNSIWSSPAYGSSMIQCQCPDVSLQFEFSNNWVASCHIHKSSFGADQQGKKTSQAIRWSAPNALESFRGEWRINGLGL